MFRTRHFLLLLAAIAALLAASAGPASAAASVKWGKPLRIEPARNGGFGGVACPTAGFCIAVDQSGWMTLSTKPTGGPGSWAKTIKIDPNTAMTGISCPTVKLCVVIDANGDVVTSINPTGGVKAWSKPAHIDSALTPGGSPAGLTGISCPTTALCVAVDGSDPAKVFTSTNPTGGARAWTSTTLSGVLTSVSCTTNGTCVVAGTQHFWSTDPIGGAVAWHGTGAQAGGGSFSAIDCPALTLCVATGYGDTSSSLVTASTTPRGATTSWVTTPLQAMPPGAGTGVLDGVGCMGNLCVAVDSADNVYTSATPGRGNWSGQDEIDPKSAPTSLFSTIGCAPTLCVVVDSNGYEVAGTPTG